MGQRQKYWVGAIFFGMGTKISGKIKNLGLEEKLLPKGLRWGGAKQNNVSVSFDSGP